MKRSDADSISWAAAIGLFAVSIALCLSGSVKLVWFTLFPALLIALWLTYPSLMSWLKNADLRQARPATENVTRLKWHDWIVLAVALILLASSVSQYLAQSFSLSFLMTWFGAILLLFIFFKRLPFKQDVAQPVLERADIVPILLIATVFGSLYLLFPGAYPAQMNTDEVVIRDQIRIMLSREPGINPLGPSNYFGFPVFVHVFFGWLAAQLGGISIDHLRTVHAFFGLLAIVFAFVFFRTLGMGRRMASIATSIMAVNHSFLSIARLVSQNATSPLLEVISLALLFRGMMTRNPFLFYAGGIAAGASFYVHPPARIIIFIFLITYALNRLSLKTAKQCCFDLLPVFVGFAVAAFPMLWSMHEAPKDLLEYQHGQFLIFPEGRKIEQAQVWAKTELDGVAMNIQQGLLAFNYPIHDNSNIYINYGFGFVDALTGAMIWAGLLYLAIERKERALFREADTLCATGFLFLWLIFSFIITFAPSYTRLTITLPYVGYLAAFGLLGTTFVIKYLVKELPEKIRRLIEALPESLRSHSDNLILAILMTGIAVLNFESLWKFTREAKVDGDRICSSFRAVEKHRQDPDRRVLISADDKYQYYTWGMEGEWVEWIDGDDLPDRVTVIKPDALKSSLANGPEDENFHHPFMLFLNSKLWAEIQKDFAIKHPVFRVDKMLPDGSLVSVTVDKGS